MKVFSFLVHIAVSFKRLKRSFEEIFLLGIQKKLRIRNSETEFKTQKFKLPFSWRLPHCGIHKQVGESQVEIGMRFEDFLSSQILLANRNPSDLDFKALLSISLSAKERTCANIDRQGSPKAIQSGVVRKRSEFTKPTSWELQACNLKGTPL